MTKNFLVSLILGLIPAHLSWAETKPIEFEKRVLVLAGHKLEVEIADNPEKTARGLMYRKSLPEGTGMLFSFADEQTLSFWMKNTFIPLSIGYFNKDKVLVDIQHMEPASSLMETKLPSYPSKKPAQYALEVPKGWFKKHNVEIGSTFELRPKN